MTRFTLTLAAAATILAVTACSKSEAPAPEAAPEKKADAEKATIGAPNNDPHAGLSNLEIDAVEGLIQGKKATPVDANGDDTREEYGTLPGAIKLSSSRTYAMSELPPEKDAKLVFYCGSTACTAAPKAAKKAIEAGYKDVHVMRAGIKGWVKAGKTVEKAS